VANVAARAKTASSIAVAACPPPLQTVTVAARCRGGGADSSTLLIYTLPAMHLLSTEMGVHAHTG
jgi:hypothetical protein